VCFSSFPAWNRIFSDLICPQKRRFGQNRFETALRVLCVGWCRVPVPGMSQGVGRSFRGALLGVGWGRLQLVQVLHFHQVRKPPATSEYQASGSAENTNGRRLTPPAVPSLICNAVTKHCGSLGAAPCYVGCPSRRAIPYSFRWHSCRSGPPRGISLVPPPSIRASRVGPLTRIRSPVLIGTAVGTLLSVSDWVPTSVRGS
jgi:hypothetical protein